jgi:hypothetical protein
MAAQNWWEEVEEVDSSIASTEETPWWETVEEVEGATPAPTPAAPKPIEPTAIAEPAGANVEKPWYEQVEIVEPIAPRAALPTTTPEPEESFLRPLADPFLNIGAGINDVVKGFADAFGADNAVSQNLAKNSEWYRSLLSAGAKEDAEEIGRIMQEAEGQGVLAEIGAGLKALSVAPVDLVSQGIGSLIPFIATAGVGKAVGLSRAGVAVLQGVQGGAVGGGIVKGEIYDAVKEQLINSGVDEAKAEKAASEAQAYNGKNLDQIMLGTGLGIAASATGAEGAIRALITRKVGKEAAEQVSEQAIQEVLRTGFVRGAVKDGIVETATEALQGGQERLAANVAVGREGFDVEPMRGVFGQATLEGALGGVLGGAAGGISAKAEQLGMRESVALRDAAKAANEAKQSNAPASAAAVEEQIEQVGETLNIPATVTPRREGETDQQWRARIERERAETPEQRVARLQEEATAAAGIELEEGEVGVEPTVPVTPPVAPTPEGAVAPVEPSTTGITEGFTALGEGAVEGYYSAILQSLQEKGEVPSPERKSNVGQAWDRVKGQMEPEEFVRQLRINAEDPSKITVTPTVAPPAEVAPTPEAITTTPTPNLEPLRRVARAEQAPEDIPSLVDAGLVEVYKDQPVLTDAGIAQLPETERPRLTPEARKIQIDTGSNEVVAEAIAKNLRIGVDQVGTGVRMPAGWTLVEDIYVPPKPIERIAPSDIETVPDIEESADVFASIWGNRPRTDVDKILSDAQAERQKQPRTTSVRPLTPKEFLEKSVRFALKAASRFNFNPETRKREVMFADIAAVLAEAPIPALDDENIIKLSSRNYRGRERRFWGGDIGMASTMGMQLPTFIHEVGHSLTADQLRQYGPQMRGAKPINGKKYIDQLRTLSGDNTIPQPVRNIFTLYVSTIEQLGLMDLYGSPRGLAGTPNPDVSMNRALELQRDGKIPDTFTRGDFYALANIYEFVSQTFTEQSFRDKLKDLKSPIATNKSLWQEFVTAIRQILGLPNDSMAAAVIEASLDISMSVPAQRELARKRRGRGGAATPSEVILRPEFRSMSPEAYADYLESAPESERENIDIYENSAGWRVYEGREIISKLKPNSTKFRRISDKYIALPQEWEFVANVDGVPYGLTKEEDPDDENLQIWAFGRIGTNDFVETIYNVGMEQEVMDQMRQDLIEKQAEEPMAPVEEYTPRTEEEQKAFDKASSNKVLARNPQLAVAAVRMKNGEISAGEYADLVDAIDPFTAKGADPIPTKQKIQQYIAADKADQVMQPIESGKEVEFRIDIPTYNRSTAAGDPVYAVTAHEPMAADAKGVGKVISFVGVAKVNNPTFMTRAISGRGAAADIAAGAGKFPLATVKGNYDPITELPADINDPNVWTEVGYNPIRSSFFVDVRSKDAVVGGSEAIMVGSRVFVKDAVLESRPTGVTMGELYAPPEEVPTFTEGSPEASTLSNMKESMAKVDAASEAKGPTTYKISEIASIWMDQGGDTRQLQDLITENTNLTPANAKKVANAIAKQYGLQQSIAEARIETAEGVSLEGLPEGVTIPKEADPKRPKTVIQRLIDVTTGVRVKPTMLTVNEKTALKDQIRLKAAATREAKKAQQETANEVVDIIKAMELRGPVRPKQAQALAKRAAKVIWTSEKSMESFMAYAEKVVANTNYDADLREAKAAQKRALELSKRSTVASPQQEILANIAKIGVNMLENPREFADVVNYYMRGFKPVVSPDYVVVPDDEVTSYLSQAEDIVEEARAEFDRVVTQRLSEKYGVSPDKIQSILDAQDIERALTQYAKREVAEAILNEKANEVLAGLKAYDQTGLRADQRKIIDSILKLDPSLLSSQERQQFVRTGNNIIFNNQTHGAELFAVTAKGQQMAKEAASNEELIAKNKAWVDVLPSIGSRTLQKTWRNWALELQSVADTFRNAFGKGSMAKVYRMMGMYDLDRGFTAAANTVNQIQEEVGAFYNKLEKKYKDAARNQDGILAEGIVGFLIQKVPEKGEVESLAQRRDLIQQDIRNRRISNDPDRVEMADRIERILQQLDGESVAAIMSNLKRDYRANHESLTWLKDQLLPKYKDFLKNFDENFNDQANNYENPDYLPIGFIRSGPSLAITPENEALYYEHVSLRPKQSSYTIKRADYTKLPTDKTTNKPKEIEFNLRRNTFDSLSDQVNKAYTSPAWQQIFAFMKTPESEKLFGGMANKEFFIERLNRLRLSRMRRGSMSSGYIEKTADALSVMARKIGTGIALGGFYQPAKQAPDQIIAVVGTTGRADLLAENMSPSNLKAAKIFLDKFSIGRRGDASSGYKYINQMEGAQNKIERYLSESKWDAAKEQAGKVADVWLFLLLAHG